MMTPAQLLLMFQSTLPVKGATDNELWQIALWTFQSTLPVKGATWQQISISGSREQGFNPRSQ